VRQQDAPDVAPVMQAYGYRRYFDVDAQEMTLDQIRKIGIDALNQKLRLVGAIRFLQQTETGWGNYTKDREKWLGDQDLKELFNSIKSSEQNIFSGNRSA